jgi:gluconate 2-dehydrogenase gamma chain
MQRRDVLKMLAAGAAVPVFSSPLLGFFREAHGQVGEGYKLRTLNAHQNDTVLAMIDQIIPATDTPGAKGARVNEFIDVILTEWATDGERENFLNGLADVDKRSTELYGKSFVDAAAEQQVTLLRAMDEVAMSERREAPRHGNTVPELDAQLKGNFFRVFKGITLHGYYTSEIGFSQELKLQIIPGAQHGCQPLGPGIGEA